LHWVSYLQPAEICKLSQVSKYWQELAQDDFVWKHWCNTHFCIQKKKHDVEEKESTSNDTEMEESMATSYKKMFLEYGDYLSCFAKIRKSWDRIEGFLGAHSLPTLESVRKGISKTEARELKEKYDPPLDFLCSLRIHDGQAPPDEEDEDYFGLFGTCTAYDYQVNMRLLTRNETRIFAIGWLDHCLPFASSVSDTYVYFLVLKDFVDNGSNFEFKRGMVVDHTTRFERPVFLANSFGEFLETFANDLIRWKHDVVSDHLVMISSLACDGSDVTTQGVRVRANAIFLPQRSRFHMHAGARVNSNYFFVYRIRISMDTNESLDKACILKARTWRICDDQGRADSVHGPGVIGLYPKAYPGSYFEYCSCTNQESMNGYMEGSFTFEKASGETFEVEVGRFKLQAR
jgi:uncharacterized protein affecting Mg2+/Co2+ transport/cell wall assembly regulator SMI1